MATQESKHSLLICLDLQHMGTQEQELSKCFHVETCDDLTHIIPHLSKIPSGNLPDMLLLDLYWHKGGGDAEIDWNQFRDCLSKLRKQLSDSMAPHGLTYLSLIRERYDADTLPVMLHARAGELTLNERDIQAVHDSDASFILEHYDLNQKNYLICNFIQDRKNQFDVFLSYASQDKNIAEELKSKLELHNLGVFMSEKTIDAGDTWTDAIREALSGSRLVVILLTPNSLRSQWVMAEAGAAWVTQKKVIPAAMLVQRDDIPVVVSQFQIRPFETEKQREDLIETIRDKARH